MSNSRKKSYHNEWQLMCIAEDIEFGDSIKIESLNDRNLHQTLIYTNDSDDGQWVILKDQNKKPYWFNAASLDEKGKRTKQWRILGKSNLCLRFNKEKAV